MTCTRKCCEPKRIAMGTGCAVYLVDSAGVFLPRRTRCSGRGTMSADLPQQRRDLWRTESTTICGHMGNCVAGGCYLRFCATKLHERRKWAVYLPVQRLVKAAIGQSGQHEGPRGAQDACTVRGRSSYSNRTTSLLQRLRRVDGACRRPAKTLQIAEARSGRQPPRTKRVRRTAPVFRHCWIPSLDEYRRSTGQNMGFFFFFFFCGGGGRVRKLGGVPSRHGGEPAEACKALRRGRFQYWRRDLRRQRRKGSRFVRMQTVAGCDPVLQE